MARLLTFNEDCWYKSICDNDCSTCVKYLCIKTLMEKSGVPSNLHKPIKLTAPACDKDAYRHLAEIKSNIEEFVLEGRNLFIGSKYTGNGKTSWALKLMYKYFSTTYQQGVDIRAMFVSVPEFLIRLKDFNNPISKQYLHDVQSVPLVIWDDIGTGNLSNYDYTQLYVYLNTRYQKQLSNIYTSNCTESDLSKIIGQKLASRILNKDVDVIEFKGNDIR